MNSTDLEARIQKIESRNERVEDNKRWEISWARRISVATLTYISIVVYNIFVEAKSPFIVSIIPVIGYVVSTLSLTFVRRQFERVSP